MTEGASSRRKTNNLLPSMDLTAIACNKYIPNVHLPIEKITFFRKENDKFVEYLDLVKEL